MATHMANDRAKDVLNQIDKLRSELSGLDKRLKEFGKAVDRLRDEMKKMK